MMTTGAPKMAVTELMESSVGAKAVRAIMSQNRQNTAPPRKQAGVMSRGRAVPNRPLISWGTAMPTKEMGPAKAATQADSTLERSTRAERRARMFTPMLWA